MFLEALEGDRLLLEPSGLRRRIEALDELDSFFSDFRPKADGVHAELLQRTQRFIDRLETVNRQSFDAIRDAVQSGSGAELLTSLAPSALHLERHGGGGYDYFDTIVGGVLDLDEPDPGVIGELSPELVAYQPTPARHVVDAVGRLGLTENDVFVDLGSGPGHVVLLVAILTDAQCVGIELERAYVEVAQDSAAKLRLNNVEFKAQDARDADLSIGSVFYMYTPFTGSVMRSALDSLEAQAKNRPIRVCTFGPCTSIVAKEPWLQVDRQIDYSRPVIFQSN